MLSIVTHKQIILLDRSAFEKFSYSDIEKFNERFHIVCPDVFLSECFNPSNDARKEAIAKKLSRFDGLYVFVEENSDELLTHQGILDKISSRHLKFENLNRRCLRFMRPAAVLEALSLKWLRNLMDLHNKDLNQRGYNIYVDGSSEGLSLNEYIDLLAVNDDSINKKEIKNEFKKIGMLGTSQEPGDIAKTVDYLVFWEFFEKEAEELTYEEIKLIVENGIPYNSFGNSDKYILFHHWMICYLLSGEAVGMKGLDKSYFNDLMYCNYVPFSYRFVTAEKTFPLVLKPISDRFDFFSFVTFEEFRDNFLA